jgi:hypothetical protein
MAVRQLDGADVEVLLLDRDLYNTFQPQLYQVATGGLNPGDVTYALRAFAAGGDRGAPAARPRVLQHPGPRRRAVQQPHSTVSVAVCGVLSAELPTWMVYSPRLVTKRRVQ